MSKHVRLGLVIAAVLQLCILAGVYVTAQLPLWFGTEVYLVTKPVDPRSLFRGNYALLSYDISQRAVPKSWQNDSPIPKGTIVYVGLEPASTEANSPHIGIEMYREKPTLGLFIKGRTVSNWSHQGTLMLDINYGIEAYFAPKDKAEALEKQLSKPHLAVIMVDKHGQGRLKTVVQR